MYVLFIASRRLDIKRAALSLPNPGGGREAPI